MLCPVTYAVFPFGLTATEVAASALLPVPLYRLAHSRAPGLVTANDVPVGTARAGCGTRVAKGAAPTAAEENVGRPAACAGATPTPANTAATTINFNPGPRTRVRIQLIGHLRHEVRPPLRPNTCAREYLPLAPTMDPPRDPVHPHRAPRLNRTPAAQRQTTNSVRGR